VPYLSASAVVFHYEEALCQVYAPLPFTFTSLSTCYRAEFGRSRSNRMGVGIGSPKFEEVDGFPFLGNGAWLIRIND